MSEIKLRKTTEEDLHILFHFQLDAEARFMAAFTPKQSLSLEAYLAKHGPFLNDATINNQTILLDGKIVGSIAKFELNGNAEITYWIDKTYWGRGVASRALQQFLQLEKMRPIYGAAAADNIGSRKVLEKCGFIFKGNGKGIADCRGEEIDEVYYCLE